MAFVKLQPKETVIGRHSITHRNPHRPGRDGDLAVASGSRVIIGPYDDAVAHHMLKGHQFEKTVPGAIYSGFEVSTQVSESEGYKKFILSSGYGTIYGREFCLENSHEISLDALTGIKYCVVFVEVNLKASTANKASIKLQYAGAGYPEIKSDDLVKKQNGIARLVLYEFRYVASDEEPFHEIKKIFYTYEDGTVENVRCLEATAKINGRLVSNLLHYNADRFLRANRATYTDLGKGISSSGWQAVDDELGIARNSDIRHLLMCVPNAYHVTGQTYKSGDNIPAEGYYLNENNGYDFYFSKGNPVPSGATVVGVFITGKISPLYFLGFPYYKWNYTPAIGERTAHFIGMPMSSCGLAFSLRDYETVRYADTYGCLFSGDIWSRQQPLYFAQACSYPPKNSGGGRIMYYGFGLFDPNTALAYHHNICAEKRYSNESGWMQFQDIYTDKPKLHVQVYDDRCIAADLRITIFYTEGVDRYGKSAASNPFTKLDPQLEGGQR